MNVKAGVDIVYIPEFAKMLETGGGAFVKNVFHVSEQENKAVEHLAGIFAGKEAVIKALSLGAGVWLEIEIRKSKDGRPQVRFVKKGKRTVVSDDLSISHAGDYAVGLYVAVSKFT